MDNWILILKTNKYYYWKHKDNYYNCTKNNTPPITESGYYNLNSLRLLKNDK
jgi:hypothetical protein